MASCSFGNDYTIKHLKVQKLCWGLGIVDLWEDSNARKLWKLLPVGRETEVSQLIAFSASIEGRKFVYDFIDKHLIQQPSFL